MTCSRVARMPVAFAVSALFLLCVPLARAVDPYAGIFGLQGHPEVRSLVKSAGFGWVRLRFIWSDAQQSQPAGCDANINWNSMDFENEVNAAVQDGYQIMATIRGTPKWANGGVDDPARPPTDPAFFQNWAALVSAHFCGRVTAWDLWNEPNQNNYWTGTAKQYRDLILKPGIAGIQQGCPSALVVAPSVAGGSTATVNTYTRENGNGALIPGIDAYSIHLPYSDVNTQLGVMDDMNAWCNPKPECPQYFITEFGDKGDDAGTEMNQVLNKCFNQLSCFMAMVFHLHAADWAANSPWKPYTLLNDDGLPKNRFCKVEQHNNGTQVAPCPCSANAPGCAGVP